MSTFALVADIYPKTTPLELADALQVILKIPLLDAKTTAARTRGIWGENHAAVPANVLGRMLSAHGHQFHLIDQQLVVPPVKAVRVQKLQFDVEGITFYWNHRNEFDKFEWHKIVGVSAGLVYVENISRKSVIVDAAFAEDNVLSHVETKTVDQSTTEPSCLLALATPEETLRFVRLRGRGIQYAEILTDAKQAQSGELFRITLARLGNLATAASFTPQTFALVAGQKKKSEQFPDPNFSSDEEHEAHFRWFLTRARIAN